MTRLYPNHKTFWMSTVGLWQGAPGLGYILASLPLRAPWALPSPVFQVPEPIHQETAKYSRYGQGCGRLEPSQVSQWVKTPPAKQETQVWSLGWEDPLEQGMATHSSILAWRIPMDRGAWWATVHGITKSRTQLKQLSAWAQRRLKPEEKWRSGTKMSFA